MFYHFHGRGVEFAIIILPKKDAQAEDRSQNEHKYLSQGVGPDATEVVVVDGRVLLRIFESDENPTDEIRTRTSSAVFREPKEPCVILRLCSSQRSSLRLSLIGSTANSLL